ncbi:MAG: ABC transporter ATP-binding protein [Anaerolineae bacterium]|nr:ABC transporter ATP-binding protein [Anaerolineae bacterium]
MTYAVELTNVSKVFADSIAVDDVSLQIRDGEFFSLLGPSGCGKTTTLRMIAGFEMPTSGDITIHGQAMGDMPPYQRSVNTVFQSYALFPHLTVAQNVAFGLQMRSVKRAEITPRVDEALRRVRMHDYANRKPHQLSGGQQQRVALARALVNQPAVLLLDEPLGALDLKLRKQMQLELKQMQVEVGITFIYVTHDQEEALVMSDRIAVMSAGQVCQCATPQEIYEKPLTRYVADFIGETNFLQGQLLDAERSTNNGALAHVRIDDGVSVLAAAGKANLSAGQPVTIAIRPEKINLFSCRQPYKDERGLLISPGDVERDLRADADNVLVRGRVRESIYIGTDTRYVVALGDESQLVVRMQNYGQRYDQRIDRGEEVLVHWAAENARVLLD